MFSFDETVRAREMIPPFFVAILSCVDLCENDDDKTSVEIITALIDTQPPPKRPLFVPIVYDATRRVSFRVSLHLCARTPHKYLGSLDEL